VRGINLTRESVPDATTLMGFRHLLEANALPQAILEEINNLLKERGLFMKQGIPITALCSTKNEKRERVPDMHQTKKGNQGCFVCKQVASPTLSDAPQTRNRFPLSPTGC
jgi:IS5 family transposase